MSAKSKQIKEKAMTKLAEIDHLFAETKKRFGKIDIFFVNAGVGIFRPFETVTEADFDTQMNVNLKGSYFTIQKALPLLNDSAAIVLNSSINAHIGMPNSSIYAVSKAAMISLARTLSAELIGRGIRVNALSPGPVTTPIYGRLGLPPDALAEMAESIREQIPMKRFGNPEEIAKAALFLASSDSSFVLGAELIVDGGMSQL
jgi:NAD(P)-dependent dehydrogenase (short-subunit alcohol dehydrogenase family)